MDSLNSGKSDPIEVVNISVIAHMNEDHLEANLDYARGLGACPGAISEILVYIDRLGIVLQAITPDGTKTIPIKFSEPLESQEKIRPALLNLLTEATKSLRSEKEFPG